MSRAREAETLDAAVRLFQRALEVANSVSRQVLVTGGALSPLFDDRSMMSRFDVFEVPRARETARALGGSRNDLLVAASARGLGRYHARLHRPAEKLRLATPAGQRRSPDIGGNWFAPARVEMPTNVEHAGPLFGMVSERLARAHGEPALRLGALLASAIGRVPTRVLVPAVQAQADSVDVAATTLPGMRAVRHICGARVEATYPFGPRLGCPVNFTALGNENRLDVGIALDPAAITHPETFRETVVDAFEDFARAAEQSGTGARVVEHTTS
jgi:hypothetical protein